MAHPRPLVLFVAAAVGWVSGCHSTGIGHDADYDMAICVPADTIVVAGFHLDQLRGARSYQSLPSPWRALLEPVRDATYLMLAYNGKDVLIIARGRFSSAPEGAVLLTPTLAIAGSPDAIRTATRQHATGQSGAAAMLDRAAPIAGKPIWALVRGGLPLPLPGNGANLNRLLRSTDYDTVSATVNSSIEGEATGFCRTKDAATQFEETLRGIVSIAAATTRDPDLAALLRSVQIRREDAVVRLSFSATAAALEKLLR